VRNTILVSLERERQIHGAVAIEEGEKRVVGKPGGRQLITQNANGKKTYLAIARKKICGKEGKTGDNRNTLQKGPSPFHQFAKRKGGR